MHFFDSMFGFWLRLKQQRLKSPKTSLTVKKVNKKKSQKLVCCRNGSDFSVSRD